MVQIYNILGVKKGVKLPKKVRNQDKDKGRAGADNREMGGRHECRVGWREWAKDHKEGKNDKARKTLVRRN